MKGKSITEKCNLWFMNCEARCLKYLNVIREMYNKTNLNHREVGRVEKGELETQRAYSS